MYVTFSGTSLQSSQLSNELMKYFRNISFILILFKGVYPNVLKG